MNINEFSDDYLNELLDKLSKENKTMFFLGDFNINLLNYDIHPPTNEFLDSLSSHYFLPHILQPSRVTTNSRTLIDIFSIMAVPNIISGNLTASISDHLPQFLVAPNIFLMPVTLNPIIMKETCQYLIKKILYLIISQLNGIFFCVHLTQTLKNPIKLSLKSLSLYLTPMHL